MHPIDPRRAAEKSRADALSEEERGRVEEIREASNEGHLRKLHDWGSMKNAIEDLLDILDRITAALAANDAALIVSGQETLKAALEVSRVKGLARRMYVAIENNDHVWSCPRSCCEDVRDAFTAAREFALEKEKT